MYEAGYRLLFQSSCPALLQHSQATVRARELFFFLQKRIEADGCHASRGEKMANVIFGLKLDRSWIVHVICKTMLRPNAVEETLWTTTVTKTIIPNAGINIDIDKLALSIHSPDEHCTVTQGQLLC